MRPIEQEALDFIQQMQRCYWEEAKRDALLGALDSGAGWITEQGASRPGPEKAERGVIQQAEYRTRPTAKDCCLVYGWASVQLAGETAPRKSWLTALCAKTAQGMKLAHWHLSWQEECGRELEVLAENIPGGVYSCRNDENCTLMSMSKGFLRLLGYTRQEVEEQFGGQLFALVHPADRQMVRQELRRQLAAGLSTVEIKYRVVHKDGSVLWVLDKSRLVLDEQGHESFYAVVLDVTQQQKVQEELAMSLERHQVILDQTTDIIFEWDIRQDRLMVSPNWKKKFGYKAISQDITRRISLSDHLHPQDMITFWNLQHEVMTGDVYNEAEVRISDNLGNFIWCRIRSTTQFDAQGKPIKAVGVILDIDAEKKREQELLRQARYDELTGLLNKGAVRGQIEEDLARAPQGSHALMIIDLDNFKLVNDTCGHLYGDAVLSDVSGMLKRLFRATDVLGRIGGDEFLVFLANIKDKDAVEERARQVLRRIEQSMQKDLPEGVGCSIGIALSGPDARDYVSLYHRADQALYHVKDNGRHRYAFYKDAMDQPGARLAPGSAVGSRIESNQKAVDQALGQYTFRMLYEAVDVHTAINKLLGIVGRTYDVSRVYIFENSADGKRCSNTFEWCNDGVTPEIDNLQDLDYMEFVDYPKLFNEEGVFYCSDVRTLDPGLRDFLCGQGVAAMLQCLVRDAGVFRGFVGFDECRADRKWTQEQINSLAIVANVIATFLLKQRMKEKLEQLTK